MLGKALWKEWLGPGCSNNNTGALNYISVAVMKHADQKQLGKKKVNLVYASRSPSDTEGSQGWNSEQEPGDSSHGGMLLAGCSCRFMLSQFSSTVQDRLPHLGWQTVG